jgi:hypothetical protein
MAFRGQVLVNPVSGERFVFHTTAAESHGKLLEFDLVVEPHGRVPGGHVHPGQQESFEVREGVMRFRKGLRTATAARVISWWSSRAPITGSPTPATSRPSSGCG